MLTYDTPLSAVSTIKKPTLSKLERLGIFSVRDMLAHLPTRYEDYAIIHPINTLALGDRCTILGTITKINAGRTWHKKMLLTEATIEDATGTLRLIWFNQRFVTQTLKVGSIVRVSGKITRDTNGPIMSNPAFEYSSKQATHTGRLVPLYQETAGLTSKFFRWQLTTILQKITDIPDPLPAEITQRLHLPSLKRALTMVHFPKDETSALLARKRFAFDEMFLVQLKALQIKAQFEIAHSPSIMTNQKALAHFIASLPFALTQAQHRASTEILHDLSLSKPMNRLLNGDVGSGKTIVATLAIWATAEQGYQIAILAPTEILARQHFQSLSMFLFKTGHQVALLTGNYHLLDGKPVKRPTLIKAIQAGIPRIIVGTHALLQNDVMFDALALIVVDEQHRFGVAQRAKLQEATLRSQDGDIHTVPHFLTMTATPIPRTLTLAFFGNLDISILDELPKNRKPIITKIANNETAREKVYTFVRNELAKGRQVFVILPLVEESSVFTEVKSAIAEHQRLAQEVFPQWSVGLLHGKMKSSEKEAMMRDFKEKKYAILVATAVVEVGIDVPNASCMLIEEAERFGLAQLHQFRGRIGRGEHQSYCFLLPGVSLTAPSERLRILAKTNSGFEIAEADLALRGPGAFFGTRQSGIPDITMENLTNIKLIQIAREEAKLILSEDPDLSKHPLLKQALKKFEERIHFE